jgi:Predicted transcriptional regulators
MEKNYRETAKIFKALSDENRLRILDSLHNGEMCACELLDKLKINQSTLSHHMKILCEAEIVCGRKEGKWTYYSINEGGRRYATNLLQELTTVSEEITVGQRCCG